MSTEGDQISSSEQMQSLSVNSSDSNTVSASSSSQMSAEERFRIVRSVGEECIQEDELLNLLSKKPQPTCYDGFEPSGRMHIAQGVMKTISVNKLTSAGCKVKIWIADWFAQLNNKMGGDLKKIQTVGRYLIEIWKAVGMDLEGDKVEFLWSSEEINSRASEYWPLVMDIARRNKLPRIMRCVQIMGRSEQDELTAAQILYPCMQCADIFFLKVYSKRKKRCQKVIHLLPSTWKMKRTYKSFEELAVDYESGELHPGDLKPALSKAINEILQMG